MVGPSSFLMTAHPTIVSHFDGSDANDCRSDRPAWKLALNDKRS